MIYTGQGKKYKLSNWKTKLQHIIDLVQDWSILSALAMEILQSYTKSSI